MQEGRELMLLPVHLVIEPKALNIVDSYLFADLNPWMTIQRRPGKSLR
jgi:hypothetical protein